MNLTTDYDCIKNRHKKKQINNDECPCQELSATLIETNNLVILLLKKHNQFFLFFCRIFLRFLTKFLLFCVFWPLLKSKQERQQSVKIRFFDAFLCNC